MLGKLLKYRKRLYLVLFFFSLMSVSAEETLSANSGRTPRSVVVTDGKIFFGESGGTVRVFDMEKRAVISKLAFPETQKVEMYNDNGRILANAVSFSSALFEIHADGNAEKIGKIPYGLVGVDKDSFYHVRNSRTREARSYLTFRLDKKLENRQEGHFPDFPDLAVHLQTEDAQNYWFFCTIITDLPERGWRGFSLIKKSKETGERENRGRC